MRPRDRFQWLIRTSDLPPLERSVLLELSWYMDFHTLGDAHPGVERLAQRTGWSVSSVKRALRELEAKGWIVRVQTGGRRGDHAWSSMYRGVWPKRRPKGSL
jgi:DNA-binding MarR family transcriptional regulator